MATSIYNAEVLGRSVLIRFEENEGTPRSFYYLKGIIGGYKIVLKDVFDIGQGFNIEHLVEFEAGEKAWFDLVVEEAEGRLQWTRMEPFSAAASLAAPSPAKKIKLEQHEPTHTETKGVDDPNAATDSLHSNIHEDTLKSSSLQNAKSSPGSASSATLPGFQNCIPLKPPIPSHFQGDMEKVKSAKVPDFSKLANFSAHRKALPEGMRCCVLCGEPRPFGKSKQSQDCAFVIPAQNKGVCGMCDITVWVVASSGLEIKWCKRCKNFRPWAAFGVKGRATKCSDCREEQRKKYAEQKKENNARFTEKSSEL